MSHFWPTAHTVTTYNRVEVDSDKVKPDWANPYGNGHAAKRIHQIISSKYMTK